LQVVAVAHGLLPLAFLMLHRSFFLFTCDSLSALIGSEIIAAAFHDAIMTFQFQLTLRRFVIVYDNLDDSRCRPMIQATIKQAGCRRVSPSEVSACSSFFLFSNINLRFGLHSCQTSVAAAFSL